MSIKLGYDVFRNVLEDKKPCFIVKRTFVSQANHPVCHKSVASKVWALTRYKDVDIFSAGEFVWLPMTDSKNLDVKTIEELTDMIDHDYKNMVELVRKEDVLVELLIMVVGDSFGMAMIEKPRGY